jgi:hypothetical protein
VLAVGVPKPPGVLPEARFSLTSVQPSNRTDAVPQPPSSPYQSRETLAKTNQAQAVAQQQPEGAQQLVNMLLLY